MYCEVNLQPKWFKCVDIDEMKSRTAIRKKIASFEKRFGEPHLYLAYHAAFPLALTPDLLYRLWANFQRDINGQFLNIPWIGVTDILLSGLCDEVGQELYEMDERVRNELLQRLQENENFGQQRIQELSDFLLSYVRQQLQSDDPDIRDIAQAQQWTVLAYTKPGKAAREIALAFQQLGLDATDSNPQDKMEMVRMASMVDTFSEPLAKAGLQPLLVYARGINSWARGNLQQAAEQLDRITEAGKIQIAGVDLPIPEEIQNPSVQPPSPVGQDYSGQNLRGRSFKGKDLTGANFSNANIRSTDFTDAVLIGANFSRSQMGLQRRWATVLMLFSLLLSIVSGLSAILVGVMGYFGLYLVLDGFSNNTENIIIYTCVISIGFIYFLILCITTIRRNLKPPWNAGALTLLGAFLFAASLCFPLVSVWSLVGSDTSNIVAMAASGIALVSALALTRAITGKTFSRTMAFVGGAVTLVLTTAFLMGKPPLPITVMVALTLIATVLVLGLIWAGNRVKRLSRILAIVSIFALLVALVTGIILVINQVEIATIALIVPLTAILAVVVVIPLMLAGVVSLSGTFIATLIIPVAIAIFFIMLWIDSSSTWTGVIFLADISIVTAIIAWATIITIAITVNLTWAEANNKAIAIGWTLLGTIPLIVITVIIALFAIPWLPVLNIKIEFFLICVAAGAILASSIPLLGTYIGWRALVKDKKFISIRNLAIAFAAKGGTSFRGANLTDANFTEATLKSADFRGANLTRTRWFHTQKLDHSCVENTYLQFPQVRQLVITGMGQDKNFDYLNLQGINLQQVNLADASFIGTNLKDANLSSTNLSRARLINTQLDNANLFATCLTGAYMQNVEITAATQLNGIECQYIFTRLPTRENPDPERLPGDYHKIFKPGELIDYLRNK